MPLRYLPASFAMLPLGSRGGPAPIDALAKPLAGRDLTREEATRLLETEEPMAALLEVAGDKPELAFASYRDMLAELGHRTTVEYVHDACEIALRCGLLPHTNAGLLTREEMQRLKAVNVSLGLMLENVSPRLRGRGQVHQWAPDKEPARRLRMLREAGELQIPFTTGLLIGIGETLAERVDTLFAIRDLHRAYGHIQEVIVQPFRAKPTIRLADAPEPGAADVARTVAVARLV